MSIRSSADSSASEGLLNVSGTAGGHSIGSRGMTTAILHEDIHGSSTPTVIEWTSVSCTRHLSYADGIFTALTDAIFIGQLFLVAEVSAGQELEIFVECAEAIYKISQVSPILGRWDVFFPIHAKHGDDFCFTVFSAQDSPFRIVGHEHFSRLHLCITP
jgi:hypothetical protein